MNHTISFMSYPAGAQTQDGKSLAGHAFVRIGDGATIGWCPGDNYGVCIRDDESSIQHATVRADFIVGNNTIANIQTNVVNVWLDPNNPQYNLVSRNCVDFVKAILTEINNNIPLAAQQIIIPTNWFPTNMMENLRVIAQGYNGQRIAN